MVKDRILSLKFRPVFTCNDSGILKGGFSTPFKGPKEKNNHLSNLLIRWNIYINEFYFSKVLNTTPIKKKKFLNATLLGSVKK